MFTTIQTAHRFKTLLIGVVLLGCKSSNAQDSSKVFFTTGVGIIKSPGKPGKVFQPSIAFNSGIELVSKHKWYGQVTLDFNTLRYNQQLIEHGSPYLFKNANSSLFMIGINGGRVFQATDSKWFFSTYVGGGYLNLGQPRLQMDADNVIRQTVARESNIFGKTGTRIGYKTPIKFLQTIYFDASWFASPVKAQGFRLNGFSFFVGTRMSMK